MAKKVNEHRDPVQRAAARVGGLMAYRAASDPMQVVSLPPLFLDLVAAEYLAPAERCLDDCMTLVHAYAQLGIPAQVRAVQLTITDASAKTSLTHGTLTPWWEDGKIHGHTVVWLPTLGSLVDVTAEQFSQIAALDEGPVIATRLPADTGDRIQVRRKGVLLTYVLAPLETTVALLDHPVPRADAADYRRRGVNVASAVLAIMADSLPQQSIQLIPHQRAAALVEAVRGLPEHLTPTQDRRFLLPGPGGEPLVVQLDQIPLPAGCPAVAEPNR
ncbi:hypothetical protein [Streptosporangium sp. CA-115845]|uniref:hypothetical protein n=1 Tax=Streptosporangium sp. CA-115845 TaxID=3240071 RepID=UPI003D94048F